VVAGALPAEFPGCVQVKALSQVTYEPKAIFGPQIDAKRRKNLNDLRC
jgi:hypothetical protein